MIEKLPWIERKFNFNLQGWMYPNVIERVRGTPARVEDVVRNLSTDTLAYRMEENTWSIQENIGHLLTLESLWATRLEELIAGSEVLTAWEETNSESWDADFNNQDITNILMAFREKRELLVERFEGVDEEVVERSALHPRLHTPMRTIDLAFFVAEHDDYHLARIAELIRQRKDNAAP